MNIVEFLEARITEDEEQAGSGWERLGDSRWERDNYGRTFPTPSAVLADCKAKRLIAELHEAVEDHGWQSGVDHDFLWCGSCGTLDDAPVPFPCETLEVLAGVYRDHPDYRQEWAHE